MKNGNQLEYIMSGTSFTRITYNEVQPGSHLQKTVADAVFKMKESTSHKFGVLYNAYTESTFGPNLKSNFSNVFDSIHADSGGLQIVTRGLTVSNELKKKIYENQAQYSTHAMSFDEIPVSFSGGKSSRLDLSNRRFDHDKFENCARITGRNIREQIETFDRMGSESKPFFIIQGNCLDTYCRWTEYALSEIPKEMHNRIGGVALASSSLGHGTLEDIKRAVYFTQIPFETRFLHLLGVGSVNRLLPNLVFTQNGFYNDVHISYDSTTHTSGTLMGKYHCDGRAKAFPREFDKKIYQEMTSMISRDFGFHKEAHQVHELLNTPSTAYRERTGSRDDVILTTALMTLSSIKDFMKTVDSVSSDKAALLKYAKKESHIFSSLFKVKSLEDFQYWEKHVGKHVSSNSVQSGKQSNLESLFE